MGPFRKSPLTEQPATSTHSRRGPSLLPEYFGECFAFLRGPTTYVLAALKDDSVPYSPAKALTSGVAIAVGFLIYETRRSGGLAEKISESLFFLLTLVLFALVIYPLLRAFGGTATFRENTATLEYIYGFLVPSCYGVASILSALVESFPGVRMRLTPTYWDIRAVPTTRNHIIISAAQAILIGGACYMAIVMITAIAAVQKLRVWRVTIAYVLTLGLLLLVSPLSNRVADTTAEKFRDILVPLVGGD